MEKLLNETSGSFEIFADNDRLYFEHVLHGEERAICIYLDEQTQEIVDYDMASCIPEQVGRWLEAKGYNVQKDENDGYWDIV